MFVVIENIVLLLILFFLHLELVLLVEETARSENHQSPEKPIYLVGESIGGCLALAVAAQNPDIDLVLILANPGKNYCLCNQPVLVNFLTMISHVNFLELNDHQSCDLN